MKRILLMFILLLAVACGPAVAPEAVENVGEGETAVIANTPTASIKEEAEEPESTEQPAQVEPAVESEPTDEPVVEEETEAPQTQVASTDFVPAVSVAEAAEIRSQDWTIGAEEPRITIIEYGDFQ